MKKLTVLFIAILMVVAGCGVAKETPTETATEAMTEATTEETTEQETEAPERIKFEELVPDPEEIFPDGKVTMLLSEHTLCYQISDHKEGEYEAYLDASKDMGFTYISVKSEANDGSKTFIAYDKDKNYDLSVMYNATSDAITITCKKAANATEK